MQMLLQVFSGHNGSVRCGTFTPDGKGLLTGGGENDASLRLWNPKSGACSATLQGHGFHPAGAAVEPGIGVTSSYVG